MKKHLTRTMMLTTLVALAGAAWAQDAPSPPEGSGEMGARDWSQTHLSPGPELRLQVEQTRAFLDEQGDGMDSEIFRLKTEGVLDRRSISTIRNALEHASNSLDRIAEGIASDEQIDGWSARMIAYELGMAADTLARQANAIKETSGAVDGGGDGARDGHSAQIEHAGQLPTKLRESSDLLKKAARAIVPNLQ